MARRVMSVGTFFTDEAKRKIVEAVRDVESKSRAEIVVSVRARSDDYREIDLVAGVLAAVLTLAILMYHPAPLDEHLMPIETLLAFVVVSIVVNKVAPLKRLLLPKKKRAERTLTAARAQFVEQGISCTRDRSGILVFVSELERAVCVVPDIGIDASKLGDDWNRCVTALQQAVAKLDLGAFVTALSSLGPVLEAKYPRRHDDVNELPDAPLFGTEARS
jgi:putative membrane protein